MLKLAKIIKSYEYNTILEIPEFEIEEGLFWLKGQNGAGKTTLLKMIAGIVPFEGEIEIDDVNLRKKPTAYRRLVSFAEAEPAYPPFITGRDLVNFYQGVRRADKQKTNELVERLRVNTFYKNDVGTYSSGMLKRLSLVLAFIGSTKYILLDEPLVTIDQRSLPDVYSIIREYLSVGVNFIFTSHQFPDQNHLPKIQELAIVNRMIQTL